MYAITIAANKIANAQLMPSMSFSKSSYFKNGIILIEIEAQTMISKKVPCMNVNEDDHTALVAKVSRTDLHGQFNRQTFSANAKRTIPSYKPAKTAMLPKPSRKFTVS